MMHVFCHQSVAVIDHDPVTGTVAPSCDHNSTRRSCICRCSGRRRIIISFMPANQTRREMGLEDVQVHDTERAIQTAIEAVRRLIRRDGQAD